MPYSDSENDLTLNDRIKDIYKNYTFCEKNCQLVEIIFEEYKAVCDCTIKQNMNVKNSNFNISNIQTEKKNNNFQIIKCANAFASIKDNMNNIGFWAFLILMVLNILFLILYICEFKTIKNYLSKELVNHGYIGKSDEGHAFCHNYLKKLDRLIEKINNMKNDFTIKKKVGGAPPLKKNTKKVTDDIIETRGLINEIQLNQAKKQKKEDLERKLKLLKLRMNKTKKVNKIINKKNNSPLSNSGIQIISNRKKKIKTEINYNSDVNNNYFKLNLMNINVNDIKKKTHIPKLSKDILNIYNFEEAILYDKRSFLIIYYIFLIAKQVIMHAIFYKSPIEPLPIRLSLLKFMLGCDLALNAIFYTDDKVSEKYNSAKSLITFALTNNLIVILLSTLIGYVLFIFLANMNNSTNEIRNLFREEEDKIKKNKKYNVSLLRKKEIISEVKNIMKKYKIKVIIFYIIEFLCMIFFWYYVTVFCNIYKKTQLSWLIDCLITIIIRIIIDFLINIVFALLYNLSIRLKSNCLFRVTIFLYSFS